MSVSSVTLTKLETGLTARTNRRNILYVRCRQCGELDKAATHECTTLWECEIFGPEGAVGQYHGMYAGDAARKVVKKWGKLASGNEIKVRVRAVGRKKWEAITIAAYTETLYYERV